MSEPTHKIRISCPGCGRRRDWKPEYADTTLVCPCGATFVGNPGPSEILSTSNSYDLHAGETRKSGHTPASERTAFNDPRFPTKRLPPRTTRATHEMSSEDDDASPLRDFYVPLGLLVIGLLLRFGQTLAHTSPSAQPRAIALVVFSLILVLIAWGLAFLVAMSTVGLELGDPKEVLLKASGAAIFVTAMVNLAASIDQQPDGVRGMIVGINVLAILAFVIVTYLFKLDLLHGLWTSIFILIAQLCVVGASIGAMGSVPAKGLFFGMR